MTQKSVRISTIFKNSNYIYIHYSIEKNKKSSLKQVSYQSKQRHKISPWHLSDSPFFHFADFASFPTTRPPTTWRTFKVSSRSTDTCALAKFKRQKSNIHSHTHTHTHTLSHSRLRTPPTRSDFSKTTILNAMKNRRRQISTADYVHTEKERHKHRPLPMLSYTRCSHVVSVKERNRSTKIRYSSSPREQRHERERYDVVAAARWRSPYVPIYRCGRGALNHITASFLHVAKPVRGTSRVAGKAPRARKRSSTRSLQEPRAISEGKIARMRNARDTCVRVYMGVLWEFTRDRLGIHREISRAVLRCAVLDGPRCLGM